VAASGAYAAGKRVEPWAWWHPDGTRAAPEQCRYEMPGPGTLGGCVAAFVADAQAPPPNVVAAPPSYQPAKPAAADLRCGCRTAPSGRLTWTPAEPRGLGQRVEIAGARNPTFAAPGLLSTELSPHAGAADLRQAEQHIWWRVLTRVSSGGWVPGPAQAATAQCYPCDLAR
jgi:hypothetical protein